MKRIYYLQKIEVDLGDLIAYKGFKTTVTEELIELNPGLFTVKDSMQELLDKAREDYPIGTMLNSKYGIQKVLSDKPFMGGVRVGIRAGIIQVNTDLFPGGATIYTPEDGWAEILPLKFITEDGVSIYEDMKTWVVDKGFTLRNQSNYAGAVYNYKYFYHKENALAYIEKHKEKTLDDYENMLLRTNIDSVNAREVCWFYSVLKVKEPKLYYTKILQLIADDLNGDWEPDFNNERQKKWFIDTFGVKAHCSVNYGLAYFKSRELAEKARVILGGKLDCLLN